MNRIRTYVYHETKSEIFAYISGTNDSGLTKRKFGIISMRKLCTTRDEATTEDLRRLSVAVEDIRDREKS